MLSNNEQRAYMENDAHLGIAPAIAGVVDYQARPITSRSTTGRWAAVSFIIAVEMAERFAFLGIGVNLITYLTGPLREPTAAAAAAVNTLLGLASMMPLLGALVADSWLGRYRTIVLATLLYILGLGMLTLSSVLPSTHCSSDAMANPSCPPTKLQVIVFYVSLYLVGLAQGGYRPCVQAFGADQFDPSDPSESKSRSSFFNWWFFCLNFGMMFIILLNYVQDNISWVFGFGIPCIAMVLSLLVFLAGTRTYRYSVVEAKSPLLRIGKSFKLMLGRWWRQPADEETSSLYESLPSRDFELSPSPKQEDYEANEAHEIEEAKAILRLFPIWSSCLIYGIAFVQTTTLFTKQASTLDRRITPNFQVPAAALQTINCFAILFFVPIYDHILVPLSSTFSSGITMLRRIGTGILLSILGMVVCALVEIKRLRTAREHGLIDSPEKMIPMSIWWMMPQSLLYAASEVFAIVGLQEFFYDQVPDELRSVGLAAFVSILGIGSILSGILITLIDKISTNYSGGSWFDSNLNRAHLDYFYWFLAGLSAVGLLIFLFHARRYIYRRKDQRCYAK